jgi:hypothetical protein
VLFVLKRRSDESKAYKKKCNGNWSETGTNIDRKILNTSINELTLNVEPHLLSCQNSVHVHSSPKNTFDVVYFFFFFILWLYHY